MNRTEALVGLNKICDIASRRLETLLNYFKAPENILNASLEKLEAVQGIGRNIAHQIHAVKKEDVDIEFKLAKELNLQIITIYDEDYPHNLREIPGAPIVLYMKGQLKPEDKFSIAIVGSRRASFYGLSCAEKFASELSDYGFTIVSGMARGVDTAAHKGALKKGGRTIAVMGSGFSHIYPAENQELAEEISGNGAVISEFPIDTLPKKENFPRRNRIISGLSLGVLVVEAARNSGALITADFGLEQGREVFALPGKVDANNSFGTNGLIKQGAKLVSCVEDILEEFNLVITKNNPGPQTIKETFPPETLEPKEALLYNLISDHPILLDEIAQKSNLNIPAISELLLRLQFKKLIKQLPGKQFVRSEPWRIKN